MQETRREQIRARLQEMTCVRASAPVSGACLLGWGPNEDGTKTHWRVGPGPSLDEGPTLRADADPCDFEQLRLFLATVSDTVA